jgi:two-component system response regulator YesN
VHYIDHNYPENITLENIAPLFGYNSSYLGKIFSKRMGVNFNTYLDGIRIEHSKQLLLADKTQVYKIAELVGYRNVDYFHIKFKKNTGITPAEFRRQNKPE